MLRTCWCRQGSIIVEDPLVSCGLRPRLEDGKGIRPGVLEYCHHGHLFAGLRESSCAWWIPVPLEVAILTPPLRLLAIRTQAWRCQRIDRNTAGGLQIPVKTPLSWLTGIRARVSSLLLWSSAHIVLVGHRLRTSLVDCLPARAPDDIPRMP